MGIDVHGLNLLRFAANRQPLGDVATLGRQGVHIAPYRLRDLLGDPVPLPADEPFCERLLVDRLGATSVESFDNSDYQGATHLVDMNSPLEPTRRYDTVVDGGTLEHIFDIRQALANVSALCADGGQILHVLPANNLSGHGFWQFSPELFFSLYSRANGYRDTSVFVVSEPFESHWFEVLPPPPGERVELTSALPTVLLVRTVRGESVSQDTVQQSDYVQLWSEAAGADGDPSPPAQDQLRASAKAMIDRFHGVSRVVRGSYRKTRALTAGNHRLSRRHPHLRRVRVSEILAPSSDR